MADYVFSNGPKPEALRQAQDIQKWGDPYGKGFHFWPVGMLDRLTAALNVYQVCQSWKNTPVESEGRWMQQNPTAYTTIIHPTIERLERQMSEGLADG